jgi:hypothetical protein
LPSPSQSSPKPGHEGAKPKKILREEEEEPPNNSPRKVSSSKKKSDPPESPKKTVSYKKGTDPPGSPKKKVSSKKGSEIPESPKKSVSKTVEAAPQKISPKNSSQPKNPTKNEEGTVTPPKSLPPNFFSEFSESNAASSEDGYVIPASPPSKKITRVTGNGKKDPEIKKPTQTDSVVGGTVLEGKERHLGMFLLLKRRGRGGRKEWGRYGRRRKEEGQGKGERRLGKGDGRVGRREEGGMKGMRKKRQGNGWKDDRRNERRKVRKKDGSGRRRRW